MKAQGPPMHTANTIKVYIIWHYLGRGMRKPPIALAMDSVVLHQNACMIGFWKAVFKTFVTVLIM